MKKYRVVIITEMVEDSFDEGEIGNLQEINRFDEIIKLPKDSNIQKVLELAFYQYPYQLKVDDLSKVEYNERTILGISQQAVHKDKDTFNLIKSGDRDWDLWKKGEIKGYRVDHQIWVYKVTEEEIDYNEEFNTISYHD